MTILDKLEAKGRTLVQGFTDPEALNYVEAGLLTGIAITGRYHVTLLTLFYNHASDPELKQIIKDALANLSDKAAIKAEELLEHGDAQIPSVSFQERSFESGLEIPPAAHLSDREIAMSLVNMHNASQLALLIAINQCYQLKIGSELRKQLNLALDWGYRLLELMLEKGWLPQIPKVKH